jgi:hypothetical protein
MVVSEHVTSRAAALPSAPVQAPGWMAVPQLPGNVVVVHCMLLCSTFRFQPASNCASNLSAVQ